MPLPPCSGAGSRKGAWSPGVLNQPRHLAGEAPSSLVLLLGWMTVGVVVVVDVVEEGFFHVS